MIPEIDIWRAASLMLKRYGEKALDYENLKGIGQKIEVHRIAITPTHT
jgi:hypothetical protein